ncbi:MAG: GntR family transcriptional regulator [Oscillospiraceae bacterium]|nr:GntR family transcriptional regulator [Oscillospiraceae bacterium]
MNKKYTEIFDSNIVKKRQEENPFIKLNDVVYDCIKQAINSVKIYPGERLNITEIAKTLNVSITPVKNAIQLLINEGLVEYNGVNGGYYVFDVNEKELTDIYDLRKCHEGFAAFLCAQRLALVNVDKLKELALQHQKLWLKCAEGDNSHKNQIQRIEVDSAFHEMMVQFSDNEQLYREYIKKKKDYDYAMSRSLEYWKIDNGIYGRKLISEDHLIIVRNISTGIPSLAREAAEQHVQFEKTQCLLHRNRQCGTGYRE